MTADAPALACGGGWLNSVCGGAARPHDAVADKPQQSSLMLCFKAGYHGFKACDGASAVNDQDRGTAPEAIDQGTEVVLGFGNASPFHLA